MKFLTYFFCISDKENCQNNQQNPKSTVALAESITHTPNHRSNNAGRRIESGETITVNTSELNQMLNGILRDKLAALEMGFEGQFRNLKKDVTLYVDDKLQELTSDVRCWQGRYMHR